MAKFFDRLDPKTTEFVEKQPLFFVATAPRADDGHGNAAPTSI